jgi:hypothetical protein
LVAAIWWLSPVQGIININQSVVAAA